MANEPKSPISAFAERLEQQPSLKTPGVKVYPWRKSQAKNTSANRIVIYPTKGPFIPASAPSEALCDVDQAIAADCWGATGDATWAIMTWLIQALETQGVGSDGDPGYAWNLLGSDWDTEADTNARGEVVTVFFSVRLAVEPPPFDLGHLGSFPEGEIDRVTQDFPSSRTAAP